MSDEGKGEGKAEQVESLLATPSLASALDSEAFRRFLDQIPIAIIVAEIAEPEEIDYVNPEFEKLMGLGAAEAVGKPWSALKGVAEGQGAPRELAAAILEPTDFVGTFRIERGGDPVFVDVYSNVIEDDDGVPRYRLAAMIDIGAHAQEREELERSLREKDLLLMEVQHRVKNNLQMITALMRIEARGARGRLDAAPFDRLAGRIEVVQHLYVLLTEHGSSGEIDLGVYLGKVASSVFANHAVEGIRLDLKLDAYPVSVNVAMPTGLVVNELLTNALKHAFVGRDAGTVTLSSLSDGMGCRILIADNGVGLPEGAQWPAPGKLSALMVQSLRENARACIEIDSKPGEGVRVTIVFTRSAAAPEKEH